MDSFYRGKHAVARNVVKGGSIFPADGQTKLPRTPLPWSEFPQHDKSLKIKQRLCLDGLWA
jgi:hypothetical protein